MQHIIVGGHFQLLKKVSEGSFGEIYQALDQHTNSLVAVKLQPLSAKSPKSKYSNLEYEARLLAYLAEGLKDGAIGFIRIHYFGQSGSYRAMVMDMLGPSLEELFVRCGSRFDPKTTAMIGLQIIDRLEYIHRKKFLHRDIKPENFLIGTHQNCSTIYLIDFGLSKRYLKRETDEHIPYRDNKNLTGTPRYASLNCHIGIEQSRRDDLESIVYMLLYFLKGVLPWQNLKPDNKLDKFSKILQKKLSVSIESLCHGVPFHYTQMVQYVRDLKFTEEPDYNCLRSLLRDSAGQPIKPGDLMCWEK